MSWTKSRAILYHSAAMRGCCGNRNENEQYITKNHYASPSMDQTKATMDKGNGLVISRKDAKREYPTDEGELARLCGLR